MNMQIAVTPEELTEIKNDIAVRDLASAPFHAEQAVRAAERIIENAIFIFCRCDCPRCADFDHCGNAACNTKVER